MAASTVASGRNDGLAGLRALVGSDWQHVPPQLVEPPRGHLYPQTEHCALTRADRDLSTSTSRMWLFRGFFLCNTALLSIIGIVLVLSWMVPRERLATAMPVMLIGGPIIVLIILGAIHIRRQRRKQRSGR